MVVDLRLSRFGLSTYSTLTRMIPYQSTCSMSSHLYTGIPYLHKQPDRQVRANSEDPDQTPQVAASDQGLHCFSLTQTLDASTVYNGHDQNLGHLL